MSAALARRVAPADVSGDPDPTPSPAEYGGG